MMDLLQQYVLDNPHSKYIIAGTVVAGSLFFVGRKILNFTLILRKPKGPLMHCPPNTVLLIQIRRGLYAPSMSPFPLKLETYLRMAKIPYVTDLACRMSSKGKTPWIMYNGESVQDSQFCLEFLNNKLGKDLNKHLSKQERASAEALRIMVDEHLYWCLVYFRWVHDSKMEMLCLAGFGLPGFGLFLRMVKYRTKKALHGQGIGRHTTDEILHIMKSDLQVLSDYLDTKKYLTGEVPCEVDCSALGMLSQLIWHDSNPLTKQLMQDEFPSLVNYCERMKETFWPDWEQCTTKGGTCKAQE